MSSSPPFHLILVAQSLGAFSEVFGQRMSRSAHASSNIRMLISMSVFCCIQATVILGFLQLVLPDAVTQGQGALSLFTILADNPGLLINAVNNSIYWLALVIVLREPLGPVLVVLAFLCAAFTVGLFQQAVGLSTAGSIPPLAIVLGVIGTLLCVADMPDQRWLQSYCPFRAEPAYNPVGRPASNSKDSIELTVQELESTPTVATIPPAAQDNTQRSAVRSIYRTAQHGLFVAAAFITLAFTTGVGITVATYFETYGGLNSFGYTAVDQMLLPLTTLPLAWLLDSFVFTRTLIGEPPWSQTAVCPPSFKHSLQRTWQEVNSHSSVPAGSRWRRRFCSFWFTLIPFHTFEFARTLLFFYLVTQFDVEATYLQMTLLRIVLCWLASLVACFCCFAWVGLSKAEAKAALAPTSLIARIVGSTLLVVSILLIKDMI